MTNETKIVDGKPPQWVFDECVKAFHINPGRTIWTYGDTIYAPGVGDLSADLIEHEQTHTDQQGSDPEKWWRKYLVDPRFRLEQEAEAYGRQYAFYCHRVEDRNKRARFLFQLARTLAGSLYKVALTQQQAKSMIEVLAGRKELVT